MAIDTLSTIKSVTGREIAVHDANFDNAQMDQEGFLKVLLTSFSYQDPFETQDISKFIDNTVKLRELEIMKNFEDSVAALSNNDALFLNATNLIGQQVFYQGDVAYVHNGKTYVEFSVKENADKATIYLYDKDGDVVAKKDFSDLQAGSRYSFDLDASDVADGYYRVSVVAKRAQNPVDALIFSTAKVEGIQKDQNSIVAIVDGKKIDINNIIKIGG